MRFTRPTSQRSWAPRPGLIRPIPTRTHPVHPRGRWLAVVVAAVTAAGPAPAAARSTAITEKSSNVALALLVTQTPGATPRTATLHCGRSRAAVGGYLRRARGSRRARGAKLACKQARAVAKFLLRAREPEGVCTDILGGEQTAEVTGFVNGRRVQRAFSRQGGCAIADWDRMGLLLNSAISPSHL